MSGNLLITSTPKRKALAMAEYSSIACGIAALDIITKTANVDILSALTICPGKYLILFCGELGAVNASLEACGHVSSKLDEFLLGSPHPDIFHAIKGPVNLQSKEALALVETQSAASAIKAADTAAKTAFVTVAQIRIAHGMCGKSTVLLTGELVAVSAALKSAEKEASENGMLLDTVLIPNPDEKMLAAMMG